MNKTLALALLTAPLVGAGFLPAAPAVAQGNSSVAQLAMVQAHLKAVSSMTADFTQTDRKGQTVSGNLLLKKPGKIRFAYGKDVPMLIVADGKSLTMIDYDVKQVQRWPIKNSPLSVLLDPNRDLSRYGKIVETGDPGVVSIEVKDPNRPEYGVINMVFVKQASAPGGLMLRGWVALDSQNNRTSIRLSKQKFNVAVSDSSFRWTDPRKKTRGR